MGTLSLCYLHLKGECFVKRKKGHPSVEQAGFCNCPEMQSSMMLGLRNTNKKPHSPLEKTHLWAANHPHLYHKPFTTYIYEELKDLEENGEKYFSVCQVSLLHFPAASLPCPGKALVQQLPGKWVAWLEHIEEAVTGGHTSCVKFSKSVDGNINRVFSLLSSTVLLSA